MTDLSARLVAAREAAGLTLLEAATAFGVHNSTLWRWEKGHKTPPPYALRDLWRLYGAGEFVPQDGVEAGLPR